MFISSQSKASFVSTKFFNKSFKAYQPQEGYAIKNQDHAVIWSQLRILLQSKLSFVSTKFITKVLKLNSQKMDMEKNSKI